jgi:hypothetical protein
MEDFSIYSRCSTSAKNLRNSNPDLSLRQAGALTTTFLLFVGVSSLLLTLIYLYWLVEPSCHWLTLLAVHFVLFSTRYRNVREKPM